MQTHCPFPQPHEEEKMIKNAQCGFLSLLYKCVIVCTPNKGMTFSVQKYQQQYTHGHPTSSRES